MTRKNPETGIHEESSFGMFWNPQYADGKMIRTNKESGVCEESRWGLAWDPHLRGESVRDLPQAEYVNYSNHEEDQQTRELMEIDVDSRIDEIRSMYEERCDEIESRFEDMQDYRDSVYAIESKMSDIERICEGTSHTLGQLRMESRLGNLKIVSYLQELLDGQGDIKDSIKLVLEGQKASDALQLAISANSLEEAYEAWRISPEDSHAESVAEKKWDNFVLQQIKTATTFAEAKRAYRETRNGSHVHYLAMEKVNFFIISSTTKVKIARINYERLLPNSSLRDLAKKKWESLALQQLSEAKTPEETQQLLVDAPPDGQAKLFGEEKIRFFPFQEMIHNAKTADEAWRLFQEFAEGSKEKTAAYDKFHYLVICTLVFIDSPQKAKEFFAQLPTDPSVRELALQKWESLALKQVEKVCTLGEAKKAFDDAPPDGEARKLAAQKWESIALTSISVVKTLEELNILALGTPPTVTIQQLIKIHKLIKKKIADVKEELEKAEAEAKKSNEAAEEAKRESGRLDKERIERFEAEEERSKKKLILMTRIRNAQRVNELKLILQDIPEDPCTMLVRLRNGNKSEAKALNSPRNLALKKWNELSLIQLNSAMSLMEVKQAFDDTPPDGEAREFAAQKVASTALAAISVAKTREEIWCVIDHIPGDIHFTPAEFLGYKKLLMFDVEEVKSAEEMKLVLLQKVGLFHDFKDVRLIALEKWYKLSLSEVVSTQKRAI